MTFVEIPEIVTPVTWLEMPELLTIPQACHLSGLDEAWMRWMITDGVVLANDGEEDYLVDKDSLWLALETLVEIVHWND